MHRISLHRVSLCRIPLRRVSTNRLPVGLFALSTLALIVAGTAQAQTVRIQLSSVATVQVTHDIAPKNTLNKGDWVFFKDLLLNRVAQFGKAKSRPVAYDVGTVTYLDGVRRTMKCTVTFPGIGTVTYGGLIVDRKDGTTVFPITGGTGGFTGAKGTMTFGRSAKTPANILEVTVPGHKIDVNAAGGVA
jgi:hypothetical protein